MNRRDALKGALAVPFLAALAPGQTELAPAVRPPLLKPKRLSPGDTVGVIAPASGLKPESFDQALQKLRGLGFKTKVGKFARGVRGLFSGTEAERTHDVHWAFTDPDVRAIWCVRGGDGAPRILPELDWALIRKNPKILVGYSDISALHTALQQQCGLVTFHGPVASSTFTDYSKTHLLNVLMNPSPRYRIELSGAHQNPTSELFKTEAITAGRARGPLIGGNLTVLMSLAGTPWALAGVKGKLLFLEDIDEEPYRVDRMLTQLRQTVDLRSLAGVVLGVFAGCIAKPDKPQPTVLEVFKERLGDLGIPVIYGLSIGHIREQCTLPIGIAAELDTTNATLTLLEPAVT